MPDLATGNITMRITDEGYNVSFWVLTNSSTFNHQQQWSWSDSGVMTFDMNARGSWQLVGRVAIPNSRNVGWTIYNSGLGFPTTTISTYINRATVPPAPTINDVHPISSSAIHVGFYGNGDGGAGIDNWQIGYGVDPNYPQYYYDYSSGQTDIGGLWNSQIWYFWARGHNANGWGAWSNRGSAWPLRPPDPTTTPVISAVTDSKVHASFQGGWDGGSPVLEWQVAYGTDPNTPDTFQSGFDVDVTGLQPNQTYYFRGRGRNAIGWGAYSPAASVKMEGPPAAPSSVDLSVLTSTTATVSFAANGDNGKPIDAYQIGYGKTPAGPDAYFDLGASPSGVVTGLDPGTLYYFWGRAHNTYGWGAISALAKTAQTTAGAWANVNGTWKQAVPYVNVNGVWTPAQAWVKIAGVWKETQ